MKNNNLVQQIKGLRDLLCKDPKEAVKRLKKLPNINNIIDADDEDRYEIIMVLGDVNYYNYRFKEAISYFEKALKNPKCKDKFTCYYRLGDCYFEVGDYNKSIKYYKKALVRKKGITKDVLVKIYHGLAMDNLNMKKANVSLAYYRKIAKLCKNSQNELQKDLYQNAVYRIATCYWKLGDIKKADKYFKKTLSLPDVAPWILANNYATKGHWLFEGKQYEEAIKHYRKAIEITESEEDKKYWKSYITLCIKEAEKEKKRRG